MVDLLNFKYIIQIWNTWKLKYINIYLWNYGKLIYYGKDVCRNYERHVRDDGIGGIRNGNGKKD
jgi:hypothetical protein